MSWRNVLMAYNIYYICILNTFSPALLYMNNTNKYYLYAKKSLLIQFSYALFWKNETNNENMAFKKVCVFSISFSPHFLLCLALSCCDLKTYLVPEE